jgi:glycosyltransferase involved in cell wall biosynthesis
MVFPLYRLPLLEKLVTFGDLTFVVGADWNLSRGFNDGIDALKDVNDQAKTIDLKARRLGPWLWQHGLLRKIIKSDIDVILTVGDAHHVSTWCVLFLAKARRRKSVVLWTHGWLKQDGLIKGLVRNAFYRLADGLLIYGEDSFERGLGLGFSPEKMWVVYNSNSSASEIGMAVVNDEQRTELYLKLGLIESWPVVICATRLLSIRKIDLLLDAIEILESESVNLNLLIVCDGPELNALKKQAERLKSKVIFFGAQYDREFLRNLHALSRISVIPGTAGLPVMTAMGFGVPVITSGDPVGRMPEVEALRPGETGDFFREGDSRDLARVMTKWLFDPDLITAARQSCVNLILESYTSEVQAKNVTDGIRSFLH